MDIQDINCVKNEQEYWQHHKIIDILPKNSTNLKEVEAWRYVDTSFLVNHTLKTPNSLIIDPTLRDILSKKSTIDSLWYSYMILNGFVTNFHNSEPPSGVLATSFIGSKDQLNKNKYIGSAIDKKNVGSLAALNLSSYKDGFYINIEKNTHVNHPIHCLYHTSITPLEESSQTCVVKVLPALFPRNLFVLEENSSCTIIEDYSELPNYKNEDAYLQNVVTEIILKPGATLKRYIIQRECKKSYFVLSSFIKQEENSSYQENVITIGSKVSKQDLFITLAGSHANSELNGLYIGDHSNYLDHYIHIHHIAPSCSSTQNYRGILDHNSQGVFQGTVFIDKNAIFSKVKQLNKSLLLSETAKSYSKPQLEILTDEVECSHGCTMGQLEEEALFYLKSRGISSEESQKILLTAFQDEVLTSFQDRVVLGYINSLLQSM